MQPPALLVSARFVYMMWAYLSASHKYPAHFLTQMTGILSECIHLIPGVNKGGAILVLFCVVYLPVEQLCPLSVAQYISNFSQDDQYYLTRFWESAGLSSWGHCTRRWGIRCSIRCYGYMVNMLFLLFMFVHFYKSMPNFNLYLYFYAQTWCLCHREAIK